MAADPLFTSYEAEVQRLKDMVERLSFALEQAGVHPNTVKAIASGEGALIDGDDERA